MPRKAFIPQQIIGKLRQTEVLTGQGQSVAQAVREAGIREQSYWGYTKAPSGGGSITPR